jgi:two-component system, LytTR family, response regulator
MIRTVIIDDEIHCVKSLRWDLQEVAPDVEVVGTAASGPEGLQLIQELNPALVFLDVSMPGMNGFEMLEALPEISFSLIFTTAFDQYAALAFRKSAVDFLVKPIDKNDLSEAISKVKQTKAIEMPENNIFNLLNNYRQPEARQRIAFPTRDGYEFAMPDHILYLEAEGSYTKIFFDDKRHLLVSRSLGDIADLLPGSDFARIHHSFIVNLSGITHFLRTDGGYVQLKNGVKLMVSKSRKNEIMERLGLK